MKTNRSTTEVIAATSLLFLLTAPATFAASIGAPTAYPAYKPYAYMSGTVTNTVLNGATSMQYDTATGVTKTLPFKYSTGKISFPLANVAFTHNLLNESVKG